jgi:hypothetical protein
MNSIIYKWYVPGNWAGWRLAKPRGPEYPNIRPKMSTTLTPATIATKVSAIRIRTEAGTGAPFSCRVARSRRSARRARSRTRAGQSHRRTTRRFGGSAQVRPPMCCSGWRGWGYRGEMATRESNTKWSKIIVFLGASQHVRIEFSSGRMSA